MSKALFGTHASPSGVALLDEVRRLRARVRELEEALASAEAAARGTGDGDARVDGAVAREDEVAAPAGR